MADEWKEYVNDSRTVCKYGIKCYQKNPDHHQNFKHPPQNKRKDFNRTKGRFSPYARDETRQTPSTHNKTPKDTSPNHSEGLKQGENNESNLKNEALISEVCKPEEPVFEEFPEDMAYIDKNSDTSIFKELFLVEMPEDFFKFYEFISNCGKSVEDTLATVNLMPIGPYDLLLGNLPQLENKDLYLIHWRFFYDPPEFQAVLKRKKNSQYHIGYFRDDPGQSPVFLASNDSEKNYEITPIANNIFGAVIVYLQKEKAKSPFTAMACQKLMDKMTIYAKENNISLEEFSIKKRLQNTVTRSFHGAGIVVPYDKKTQLGYRHLVETNANLKKLFSRLEAAKNQDDKDKILSELQPVITYASIAVDECDFGTGIEVGIALFCSGQKELESGALNSLTAAYSLLNRTAFIDILKAHLKYRRRGPNMSMLSLKK